MCHFEHGDYLTHVTKNSSLIDVSVNYLYPGHGTPSISMFHTERQEVVNAESGPGTRLNICGVFHFLIL